MNYSVIQSAREELSRYESDYKELTKRVNLSLFSLARTNLNSTEKEKIWRGLSDRAKNIIEKAEKIVNKLNSIHFAEEEVILHEEKSIITQEYSNLIGELRKEKETIVRQIEKDVVPLTSLQQKDPREGYCYFCDIKISSGIPYRLTKEEQKVLEIEIIEGAGFCSQECLLDYCKEYKGQERLREDEEKKTEDKIKSGKRLITQIQLVIGDLTSEINRLEQKEKELELTVDILPSEKKVGFFRQVAQSLGLARKNSPHSNLVRVKSKKLKLEIELEKKNEELQKTLVILSVDDQVQKERQNSKKKLFQNKRNIRAKEDGENIPDE